MRVFALSDMHVDYDVNARWVQNLSRSDYRDDLLILAGDISHRSVLLVSCVSALASRFAKVLFVPGNHDLWVVGEAPGKTSMQKFVEVMETVRDCGASTETFFRNDVAIVPLLGWYDYSFGEPDDDLMMMWADYRACRWPEGFGPREVSEHFAGMNTAELHRTITNDTIAKVISFSHFLPRIDLVPTYVPRKHRFLDPVLGSTRIEAQLRRIDSSIHVYGHSHINRSVRVEGVTYINNAFGYPQEETIATKRLLCIDEIR
jgi:Icc-related predicted phosphoesterase